MQRHIWRLECQGAPIIRHCQGCGRRTEFRNSGKIRRNANGKQIYQYEIYKCDRDHTWNRSVAVTDPSIGRPELGPRLSETRPDAIQLTSPSACVEILLEFVEGKWRLDRTLAQQLEGLTRSAVSAMISRREVLLNGQSAEGKRMLRTGDVITIHSCGCAYGTE